MKHRSISATGGAAIAAFIAMAEIRPAQADETVRVRGTIASLEGSTLTVKTREGSDAALALKPEWKVIGVTAASAGDIKPGDFVGIASLPGSAGGDGSGTDPWREPPAVFGWLQEVGGVSDLELRRTFNCGVGLMLIVDPHDLADVLEGLVRDDEDAFVIGELAAAE